MAQRGRTSGANAARLGELLALIDEAWERRAWHGTNLRGALRGMSAAQAAWRPAPGRHNAWEEAVHAAYWKYAVRRRLTGEKRGSFALEGSNWFARPEGVADEAAWKRDLKLLADEHRALRAIVAALDPATLDRRTPGSKHTAAFMLRGIASHDLYHAGQIQLLKRLHASTRPR